MISDLSVPMVHWRFFRAVHGQISMHFVQSPKYMVCDDDLEHTNDKIYRLSPNQISRTSNLKWSICCPICDDSNNVVAIVALDGKTKITLDKKKETALQEEMSAFCYMLYDSVPQLFKRR